MPDATAIAPRLLDTVRQAAHPLTGSAADYDPLLDLVGGARFVLLGEASHGTHEFYRARAEITRRLIREKGFTAVAAEAATILHAARFETAASLDEAAAKAVAAAARGGAA